MIFEPYDHNKHANAFSNNNLYEIRSEQVDQQFVTYFNRVVDINESLQAKVAPWYYVVKKEK